LGFDFFFFCLSITPNKTDAGMVYLMKLAKKLSLKFGRDLAFWVPCKGPFI
jgi:hypothetical protein